LNLAEGLASGLLFGIMLVLTMDRFNGSLTSPGEAETVLRVPELGIIPARDSHLVRRLERLKNEGINGYQLPPADETIPLAAWEADSVLAESYRNVRTSILLSKNGEPRPKVILVTSVERQDGKSSTVSNLGIALAQIGQRVLLVDGDMRKPRLHTIFNTPNSWGLSDLLREKIPLKDIPADAMARKTGIGRLFLLPSGPAVLGVSDLLYSDRLGEVIARLREIFDTIIIDTPPMGYLSDARVVGRLADAAILVIRSGQTTKDSALRAKQRLTEDGIHVLGIVLNRWEPQSKRQYESYYSYHEDDR
jgi:receptor protein-tyrosine kinase